MVTADDGSSSSGSSNNLWTLVICTAFLLFLCALFVPVTFPETREQRERRILLLQQRQRQEEDDDDDDVPETTEQRAARIVQSLVVQRVISADVAGNMQLGDLLPPPPLQENPDEDSYEDMEDGDDENHPSRTGQNNDAMETNEENDQKQHCAHQQLYSASLSSDHEMYDETTNRISCCCICLEAYRVGHVVAWSCQDQQQQQQQQCLPHEPEDENNECRHVFHYDCIREWLEYHNDCPSCRRRVLVKKQTNNHINNNNNEEVDSLDEDDDDMVSSLPNHTTTTTTTTVAFYIMHGLISRVRGANYSLIGPTHSNYNSGDPTDYDDDNDNTAEADEQSRYQPSALRRALSFGEYTLQRFTNHNSSHTRRSSSIAMTRRRSTGWKAVPAENLDSDEDDDGNTKKRSSTVLSLDPTVSLGHYYLRQPVEMRRAISAGPGSPIRRTRSNSHSRRDDHYLSQQHTARPELTDEHDTIDVWPPGVALRRTNSSSLRQRSHRRQHQQQTVGEDDPDLRISVRNSVSWARDLLNSDTDRTEEDEEEDEIIKIQQSYV